MIGILNIGSGNVQSVFNAIYENGYDPIFIHKPEELSELSHLILPGVGSFSTVIEKLSTLGFIEPIKHFINNGKPTLGICLGMQLLASLGYEGKKSAGLNIINGNVTAIPQDNQLRIPHVGWNNVNYQLPHPVFKNIKDQRDFYFVHSYHMQCQNTENIIATTDYGSQIVCAVGKKNALGVQFHPEKSQKNGMLLLENFCEWDGIWS